MQSVKSTRLTSTPGGFRFHLRCRRPGSRPAGFFPALLLCTPLLAACTDPGARVAPYDHRMSPRYRMQLPPGAPIVSQQFRAFPGKPELEAQRGAHNGMDFLAPAGTPVVAAAPGTVVAAFYEPSYGNRVVLAHPGGRHTVYKHLRRIDVSPGARVARGARIGTLGATGLLGLAPHLHFELHEGMPGAETARDPNEGWAGGPGRPLCAPGAGAPALPGDALTLPIPCALDVPAPPS